MNHLVQADSEFEEAYRAHFSSVWRYAALSTRNRADADELAQEVFERAYRALADGRGPRTGLWVPWLLVTTRRLVISHHRHDRLVKWLPLDRTSGMGVVKSDCFDGAELNVWLDEITRLLPDRQREALFLRYLADLDDEAVGMVLGIGPSGVRSLVSRAMANLRKHKELWQ